jgi:hypothetical protein
LQLRARLTPIVVSFGVNASECSGRSRTLFNSKCIFALLVPRDSRFPISLPKGRADSLNVRLGSDGCYRRFLAGFCCFRFHTFQILVVALEQSL